GGCSGTCQGTCEGTCSAQGPDGQCNGTCEGTCHGSCSAGCQGSCSGECHVSGQASCSGECSGGCSVEYEEPRCTGTVRPPQVEAECEASCDARLNAEAECRPGSVEVVVTGDVSGNLEERVSKLRSAISGSWGTIQTVGAKLERLGAAAAQSHSAPEDWTGTSGSPGFRAAA